jgi:hypothetical protein
MGGGGAVGAVVTLRAYLGNADVAKGTKAKGAEIPLGAQTAHTLALGVRPQARAARNRSTNSGRAVVANGAGVLWHGRACASAWAVVPGSAGQIPVGKTILGARAASRTLGASTNIGASNKCVVCATGALQWRFNTERTVVSSGAAVAGHAVGGLWRVRAELTKVPRRALQGKQFGHAAVWAILAGRARNTLGGILKVHLVAIATWRAGELRRELGGDGAVMPKWASTWACVVPDARQCNAQGAGLRLITIVPGGARHAGALTNSRRIRSTWAALPRGATCHTNLAHGALISARGCGNLTARAIVTSRAQTRWSCEVACGTVHAGGARGAL